MKEHVFIGSAAALITPFHHETLDFETFGRLIDTQVDNGTDAVAVCTLTGEVPALSYRERMQCIGFSVVYTETDSSNLRRGGRKRKGGYHPVVRCSVRRGGRIADFSFALQ